MPKLAPFNFPHYQAQPHLNPYSRNTPPPITSSPPHSPAPHPISSLPWPLPALPRAEHPNQPLLSLPLNVHSILLPCSHHLPSLIPAGNQQPPARMPPSLSLLLSPSLYPVARPALTPPCSSPLAAQQPRPPPPLSSRNRCCLLRLCRPDTVVGFSLGHREVLLFPFHSFHLVIIVHDIAFPSDTDFKNFDETICGMSCLSEF